MNEDLIRRFTAYSQAVQTLPKTRQLVMLYEGMIRFMQQAKEAIARNDFEERYNAISKVSQIISGLHSSLDFDKGGDIARVLDGFYSSLYSDLTEIQSTNSIEKCDAVLVELKAMHSSWAKIDSQQSLPGQYAKADAQKPVAETNNVVSPGSFFPTTVSA